MASAEDKVMTAVEGALKKNPDTSVDELFEMAKGVSPSVGKLSKRQFHARYPLQVKRRKTTTTKRSKPAARKKASRAKRSKPAAPTGSARESVRGIMLRFASDLAGAEARKDVVKVVAGVDRYVDDVLKATGAA